MMRCAALSVAGLLLVTSGHAATNGPGVPADADVCLAVAADQERAWNLPPQLLSSIAKIESGRRLSDGRLVAWPWTVNVDGKGHYYQTAEQAIRAVTQFQASGGKSIDVGCNQVSLLHHPGAFASLREAFDPSINAAYAGRFLVQLHQEFGDWPKAAAAYHSRTPELAEDYGRRVMSAWPFASLFGSLAPSAAQRGSTVPGFYNYTQTFLADARFVGLQRASRGASPAVANITRTETARAGRDQSWKSRLEKLASLETTMGR